MVGAFALGFIQDKFGHYVSLKYIIALCIAVYILLFFIIERGVFDWTAFVFMFGMGMLDNSWKSLVNIIFGFEFEKRIMGDFCR